MRTAQCNTNEVQHSCVSPRGHGVQRYGSGQASIRVRHVYGLLGYSKIACSGLDWLSVAGAWSCYAAWVAFHLVIAEVT